MKSKVLKWVLFLLPVVQAAYPAQPETVRWWNLNETILVDRAIFCNEENIPEPDLLEERLAVATGDVERMKLYYELIRAYQKERYVFKAEACSDSAINIALRLNDSLYISRIYVVSVYSMDLCGNPGAMLQKAQQARQYLPRKAKGTFDEFKVWSDIARAYFTMEKYMEAETPYLRAWEIIDSIGDDRCRAHLLMSLGRNYQAEGMLLQAAEKFKESLAMYRTLNDSLKCCILNFHLAVTYFELEMPNHRDEYMQQAVDLCRDLKNPVHRVSIYRDIARFYRDQNDSIRAIGFYNKAIDAFRLAPDLGDCYDDMSEYYMYLGDKEKAIGYLQLAIESYGEFRRPVILMTYKMGCLHRLYGNHEQADRCFHEAYHKAREIKDPRTLSVTGKGMAEYHYRKKDLQQAIRFALQSYNIARDIMWVDMVCNMSEVLSGYYAEAADYRAAYAFRMIFHSLSDSLNTGENNRERSRLLAQVNVDESVNRMSTLIEGQEERIRRQNAINVLQICALALIAGLSVGIWIIARRHKAANLSLQRQTYELETSNEELACTNDELNRYKNGLESMVAEKTSELQAALERAQKSDRLKTAFFANMSHEIRTPFNAILGFLKFVFTPGISETERENMMTLINANAYQLLTLVDDIVDLSQIDSNLLVIRPEPCNIALLLEDVAQQTELMIRYSGKSRLELVIDNQLPNPACICLIDGRRTQQVLIKLLDNAVKFTAAGYIRFGCSISADDNFLHFFVEDTGIGIPPEHHGDAFKRFWKYGDVDTQRYRGVGIGLPLCKHLVGLMGGSIEIESEPEKGSTFRFSIKIEGKIMNEL